MRLLPRTTGLLSISQCLPIRLAKIRFGLEGSSPRTSCPGGRIAESREGTYRGDRPGIRHYAQALTLPKCRDLKLPVGSSTHQRRSYLGSELPHQEVLGIIENVLSIAKDITGIIADVLGITDDVLGIAEDVFGIVADALGVILDTPRPLVHSLLYRNLAGCSLKIMIGLAARTW